MKLILFYNSMSGTILSDPEIIDKTITLIKQSLNSGETLKIFDVQESDEAAALREEQLSEEDRIIIAGGDGTISSVLDKIIDFRIPVAILPLGTFNNFSKSLKLSPDIETAVKQVMNGKVINIDAAKVNGRIVINNSSVGVYPKLVSMREESQVDLKISKPTAMILSIIKTAFLFPLIRVSLESEGVSIKAKTSFVMVSNNKYKMLLNRIGERESLTEGLLYVYLIKCRSRLCVLKVLFKAMFNKLTQEKDFELISTKKVEIKIHKKEIDVAADGEVFKMRPPLRYQICTGCLRIIVPENYD